MKLGIILTFFSILSFASVGIQPNIKANEIKIHSTDKNSADEEKNFNYESKYILGTGDVLFFQFPTIPEFEITQQIDLDGYVTLSELNRIKISGLTIDEAEQILNLRYEEFLYDPNLKLNIITYRPFSVYLRGEVKKPGLYSFPGFTLLSKENLSKEKNSLPIQRTTIFDLLKIAKGVTNYADLTNILLIRDNPKSNGGGKIKTELDILSMLINGDQEQNIDLQDNDNILVNRNSKAIKEQILTINKSNLSPDIMTVFVTGNVVKQGPIEINKGSSLIQAIATSGGKKLLTGNIEFLRFNDDGSSDFFSFKYDPKAPINSKKNPILMEGDVINVKKTILGNTATVIGELANPIVTGIGLYEIFTD
tara:strand:- start:549 stop:1643 length:1095 start_codon:yes stop_codon:yes gene_type:complete